MYIVCVYILDTTASRCDNINQSVTFNGSSYFCNGGAATLYNEDDLMLFSASSTADNNSPIYYNQNCIASTVFCNNTPSTADPNNPTVCRPGEIRSQYCICDYGATRDKEPQTRVPNVVCDPTGLNISNITFNFLLTLGKPTMINAGCPESLPTCTGFVPNSDYPEYGMCVPLEDTNKTSYPYPRRLFKYPVDHSRYEEQQGVGRAACDCLSQPVVFVSDSTNIATLAKMDTSNIRYKAASGYFNLAGDVPAYSPCDFTTVGWRWQSSAQSSTDSTILTIPPGDRSSNVRIVAKSGTIINITTNPTTNATKRVPCGQYTTSPVGSMTLKAYCSSHPQAALTIDRTSNHYDARLAATFEMTKRMCVFQHTSIPTMANVKLALPDLQTVGNIGVNSSGLWDNITSDTKVHASVAAHRMFHLAMLFDMHVLGGSEYITDVTTRPQWHANPDFPSTNTESDYHESSAPYRSVSNNKTTIFTGLLYKMGTSSHNFGESPPENYAYSDSFPGSHFGKVREGAESFISSNPMMTGRLSLLGYRYAASCNPFSAASPFRKHKSREDIDFNWFESDDVDANPYYAEAVAILSCISVKLFESYNNSYITAAGHFTHLDGWTSTDITRNPSTYCSSYGLGQGADVCASHTADWTAAPEQMLLDHNSCKAVDNDIVTTIATDMASCMIDALFPSAAATHRCKPAVLRIASMSVWRLISRLTSSVAPEPTTPNRDTIWWGSQRLIWGEETPYRPIQSVMVSILNNVKCQLDADTTQMILLHAKLSYPDLFESSFVTNVGDIVGNLGTGFNCTTMFDTDAMKAKFNGNVNQYTMTLDEWTHSFNRFDLEVYTTDMFYNGGAGMFQPDSIARWEQHCMPQDFQYPGIILNTQYTIPDGIGIHRAVRNGRTAQEGAHIVDTVRKVAAADTTHYNGNVLERLRNLYIETDPAIAETNFILEKAFHIHFATAIEHFADKVTCFLGDSFAKLFGIGCKPPPPPPPPPTPAPPTRPPPPPPTPEFMTTDGKSVPIYEPMGLPLNFNEGMFYDGTSLTAVKTTFSMVAYGLAPPNPSFIPYSRQHLMSEAVVVGIWPDLTPWDGDVDGYKHYTYDICNTRRFVKINTYTIKNITHIHRTCGGILRIPDIIISASTTLDEKRAAVAADPLCGSLFTVDHVGSNTVSTWTTSILSMYASSDTNTVTIAFDNTLVDRLTTLSVANVTEITITIIDISPSMIAQFVGVGLIYTDIIGTFPAHSQGNGFIVVTIDAYPTVGGNIVTNNTNNGVFTATFPTTTVTGTFPLVCNDATSLPRTCRSTTEQHWQYATLNTQNTADTCRSMCTVLLDCIGYTVDDDHNCWHSYKTDGTTDNSVELNTTLSTHGCELINLEPTDNFELGIFVPHLVGRKTSSAQFAGNPACTHINVCGLNTMYFHTPNEARENVIYGDVKDHCAFNLIDGPTLDGLACNHHFECKLGSFCHVGGAHDGYIGEYPSRNGSNTPCTPCTDAVSFELTALTQRPISNISESGGSPHLPKTSPKDLGQLYHVSYPYQMWSSNYGVFKYGNGNLLFSPYALTGTELHGYDAQNYLDTDTIYAICNTRNMSLWVPTTDSAILPDYTKIDLGYGDASAFYPESFILACMGKNPNGPQSFTPKVSGRPLYTPIHGPLKFYIDRMKQLNQKYLIPSSYNDGAGITNHNTNTSANADIAVLQNYMFYAEASPTAASWSAVNWQRFASYSDDTCHPTSPNAWYYLNNQSNAFFDDRFFDTGIMDPTGKTTIDQLNTSWVVYQDVSWDEDPFQSSGPANTMISALYDAHDFTASDRGPYAPSRYLLSFSSVVTALPNRYGLLRPNDYLAQADYTTMFLNDATCRTLFNRNNIDEPNLMEPPNQKRGGNCMPFRFVGSDTHTGLAYRRRLFTKTSAVNLGANNPDPMTFHSQCIRCASTNPDIKNHITKSPFKGFVLNTTIDINGPFAKTGPIDCSLYGCNWAGVCVDKNHYAWIGGTNRGGGMEWKLQPKTLNMGVNGNPRDERAPFIGPCSSSEPGVATCGTDETDDQVTCNVLCDVGARYATQPGKEFYSNSYYTVCPDPQKADPTNGFDATMPYFDHHIDSDKGVLPDVDAVHYFTPRLVRFPVIINGIRHVRRRVEHPEYLNPFRMDANKPGFTFEQIRFWCTSVYTESECTAPGRVRSCIWNSSGCQPLHTPTCSEWSGAGALHPDNVTTADKNDCQPDTGFSQCVLIKWLENADGLKTTIPTAATRHLQHQITTHTQVEREYVYQCVPLAWRVPVTQDTYKTLWDEGVLRHPDCTFESKSTDQCRDPPSEFLGNDENALNRQSNMIDTSDWFAFSSPVSYFTASATTLLNLTYTVDPDVHTVPTFSSNNVDGSSDNGNIVEDLHQMATDWWTSDYSGVFEYATSVAGRETVYQTETCKDDDCNAAKDRYAVFIADANVNYPNCGPQTLGTCGVAVDHIEEVECPSRDTGTQWPGICLKPFTQLYTPEMLYSGDENHVQVINAFSDIKTSLPFLKECEYFNPLDGWDRYDPVKWPTSLKYSSINYTMTDRLLFVHYCDKYNSRYVHCDNDPLSYAERELVCNNYNGDILIGGRVIRDLTPKDVCSNPDPLSIVCYLFPGYKLVESVDVLLSSISDDYDSITIKFVPFSKTFISILLLAPRIVRTLITNDANTWTTPLETDNVTFINAQRTIYGNFGTKFAQDVCEPSIPITDDTIVALNEIYTLLMNPETGDIDNIPTVDHVTFDTTPQTYSMIKLHKADIFGSTTEYGTKITRDGVTIQSALQEYPVVFATAVKYTRRAVRFDINAAAFRIYNTVFDQSGCIGQPYQCAPLLFSGGDPIDSIVSNIIVVNTTIAVAIVGGITDVYDYTPQLDVSGVILDKILIIPMSPTSIIADMVRTVGEPQIYSCPVVDNGTTPLEVNCVQRLSTSGPYWCNRWATPVQTDAVAVDVWRLHETLQIPTARGSTLGFRNPVKGATNVAYVVNITNNNLVTLSQITRDTFAMVTEYGCITISSTNVLVTTSDCASATTWHVDHVTRYIHPTSRPFVCIESDNISSISKLGMCATCAIGTERHRPCADGTPDEASLRLECIIENTIPLTNRICKSPFIHGADILKCTDVPSGAVKGVSSQFCNNRTAGVHYVDGGAGGSVTCPTGTVVTTGYGYKQSYTSGVYVDTVYYQPHDFTHGSNLATMGVYVFNCSRYTNTFTTSELRVIEDVTDAESAIVIFGWYAVYFVCGILSIIWIILANCDKRAIPHITHHIERLEDKQRTDHNLETTSDAPPSHTIQ